MTHYRRFQNVTTSALGQAWYYSLDFEAEKNATFMAQKYDIDEPLARILSARGVDESDALEYIHPTIKNTMPNPSSLVDMDKAAKRLAKAIISKEKVAIFGDYDVDGACSTAILYRYLNHFGLTPIIYIPDRIVEGYGPNERAMSKLARDGASLIVTVDCGANSPDAILAARQAGADVVVLDHHQMGAIHDAANALVNPNRIDDQSEQGHLCAAGVVFLAIAATNTKLREENTKHSLPNILQYLDLVALATICDIVPLKGVNRAFVTKGIELARKMYNAGIAALAESSRIGEPLNSYHFGFLLGPRINAGGRIGDQALGAKLLIEKDLDVAKNIAHTLSHLNEERQKMENAQLTQAMQDVESVIENGQYPKCIVVANQNWHPGIVGIMAARLKERYYCPAFVIALKDDGFGAGSGRSITGIDLGGLVRESVELELLEKGGGHTMAAGLTIAATKINALRTWLEDKIGEDVERLRADKCLMIDGSVSATGATIEFCQLIDKAGPFGAGNPAPVFVLPAHRLVYLNEIGKGHLQLTLANVEGKRIKAMAFRASDTALGDFLRDNLNKQIHVAGHLKINYWNNTMTAQLHVIDAASL